MGFDDHDIAIIKDRISIEDLVGRSIQLVKRGKFYLGLCPWHDDTRPSLQVNPERGSWKCWVCNVGGDALSFLEKQHGLTFPEALRIAAESIGYTLNLSPQEEKRFSDRAALYKILENAAEIYTREFWNNKKAIDYVCKTRKISEETARDFRLGFAPPTWDFLINTLSSGKEYSQKLLHEAGLVAQREKKDGYYDFFRGRIMFPIADLTGRIVGFAGRDVTGEENAPKYINTPGTVVYEKHRLLYGLEEATRLIQAEKEVIVSEGYFDVIAGQQHGFPVVAVCGTAFSKAHGEVLERRFPKLEKIILGFDGDTAGTNAALKASAQLLGRGSTYVCFFPDGEDPASLLEQQTKKQTLFDEDGTDVFRQKLADTKPVFDFYVSQKLKGRTMENPADAARFLKEISSDFLEIPEDVLGVYVSELSRMIGVSTDAINSVLFSRSYAQSQGYQIPPRKECEIALLHGMIAHPDVLRRFREAVPLDFFTSQERRAVYEYVLRGGVVDSINKPLLQHVSKAVELLMKEHAELRGFELQSLLSPPRNVRKRNLSYFEDQYKLARSWDAFHVINNAADRGHSFGRVGTLVNGLESTVNVWEAVDHIAGTRIMRNKTNEFLLVERQWNDSELVDSFGNLGRYLVDQENFTEDIRRSIVTDISSQHSVISLDIENIPQPAQLISIAGSRYADGILYNTTVFARRATEEGGMLGHFLDAVAAYTHYVTFRGSHDLPMLEKRSKLYAPELVNTASLKRIKSNHIDVSRLLGKVFNGATVDQRLRTVEKLVFDYDRGDFDVSSRNIPRVYEQFLATNDVRYAQWIIDHNVKDTISPLALLHKASVA
jgi:DNA primase catalytic core